METSQIQSQPELRENVPATDSDIHSTLNIPEISEITLFKDEVPPQIAAVPDQQKVPEEQDPFPEQSIKDFLQRPRVVHSFKWTATTAGGSCLARLSFPDTLFASTTVWNKVQQFVYLHAGLHFEVRVNGTPFHYGQLLVVWRPAALARTSWVSQANPGPYDSLFTLTQYPHMLVSPSSAQVVEMTVPYESPLERIPIRAYSSAFTDNSPRYLSNLGILEFWVLTPLRGQGTANSEPPVTVSLFASFVNPHLTGYTHAQLTYFPESFAPLNSYPSVSGLRYNVQITQAGEDDVQPQLPVPSSSNPSKLPVAFIPANTSSSFNNNPSYFLSLNEVSSVPISLDTSIRDHLKIWSLLHQFNVTTNANLNSVLASYMVIPTNCATGNLHAKTILFNTKLSYIASLFSLWRGPIEYRFDFIASKFHSCRIKIAWYPPATLEAAGNEELPDAWTKVVDVQGQTSVIFTVPYLQSFPFLQLSPSSSPRGSNGTVVLTLLNSVSYPLANGPPISVNVWIRAPDCEFAAFTNQVALPNVYFPGSNEESQLQLGMFDVELPPARPLPANSEKGPKSKQVAQSGDATITSISLNDMAKKPSMFGILTPRGKIFLSPPMAEPLPKGTTPARVCRLNTILDYLMMLHVGFQGSLRIAALNPDAVVFFVPRLTFFSSIEKTFKSTTTPNERCFENRYTAGSYFPSSANSIKDVTLPNYSSLTYRPTIIDSFYVGSSSACLPGIDIYSLSDQGTVLTLCGDSDFRFVGMAPAPMTFLLSGTSRSGPT